MWIQILWYHEFKKAKVALKFNFKTIIKHNKVLCFFINERSVLLTVWRYFLWRNEVALTVGFTMQKVAFACTNVGFMQSSMNGIQQEIARISLNKKG